MVYSRADRTQQEPGRADILTIDMASRRHNDNLEGRCNVGRVADYSYDMCSCHRA